MNKELIINPDGTMTVLEVEGEKRELTNNAYEILQTENTIENLNELLHSEEYNKSNFEEKIILALFGLFFWIPFSIFLIYARTLVDGGLIIDIKTIIIALIDVVIGVASPLSIKNRIKDIKISNIIIKSYKQELENSKNRLENLEKNSVKLSPEEMAKKDTCSPIKIEEESRFTKLRNALKLKKEVLMEFKKYRKLYESGKLKEAFPDYSDEELQIITQEVEDQIRKRTNK